MKIHGYPKSSALLLARRRLFSEESIFGFMEMIDGFVDFCNGIFEFVQIILEIGDVDILCFDEGEFGFVLERVLSSI